MKTEKQLRRAGEEASEYDIGIADVVEFAGLALGLGPTTTPRSMRSLLVWSTMM